MAHARVARAREILLKGFAARLQVGEGLDLTPAAGVMGCASRA